MGSFFEGVLKLCELDLFCNYFFWGFSMNMSIGAVVLCGGSQCGEPPCFTTVGIVIGEFVSEIDNEVLM